MVTGSFYGALAASASVFLGILTALISNHISQIRSEQRQLEHQQSTLQNELENLRAKRNNVIEQIDEIQRSRESHAEREARQNIEKFEEAVENNEVSLPAEHATVDKVFRIFSEYIGEDPENIDAAVDQNPHRELIEERYHSLQRKLAYSTVVNFADDYDLPGNGIFSSHRGLLPDSPRDYGPYLDAFITSFKNEYEIDDLYGFTRSYLEDEFGELMEQKKSLSAIAGPISSPSIPNLDVTEYRPAEEIESDRYKSLRSRKADLEADIEAKSTVLSDVEESMQATDTRELIPVFYGAVTAAVLSVIIPIFGFWMEITQTCFVCSSLLQRHWLLLLLLIWLFGFALSFLIRAVSRCLHIHPFQHEFQAIRRRDRRFLQDDLPARPALLASAGRASTTV